MKYENAQTELLNLILDHVGSGKNTLTHYISICDDIPDLEAAFRQCVNHSRKFTDYTLGMILTNCMTVPGFKVEKETHYQNGRVKFSVKKKATPNLKLDEKRHLLSIIHGYFDSNQTSPTEYLNLSDEMPDLKAAFLNCATNSIQLNVTFIGNILTGCMSIDEFSVTKVFDYQSGKQKYVVVPKNDSIQSEPTPSAEIVALKTERDYWAHRAGEQFGIKSTLDRIHAIIYSPEAELAGMKYAVPLALKSKLSVSEALKFMSELHADLAT